MTMILRLTLYLAGLLAAVCASLPGAWRAGHRDPYAADSPADRERRARDAAGRGALVDPTELRCEARAAVDPGEADPCHTLTTVRTGTRHGEPVHGYACRWCGSRAVDIRAAAGDQHAARDLAGTPTPRRPWLERP